MDALRIGALAGMIACAHVAMAQHDGDTAGPRFYASGMIGSSFATLTDTFHDDYAGTDGAIVGSLFTAGGAAGYAFERPNGQVRLEVEGRGRDTLATHSAEIDPGFTNTADWSASNGWSVLTNVWRDVRLNDRFGVYAGGGIGAGGYDYSLVNQITAGPFTETFTAASSVATFAWQAGGGMVHRINDRVEFDVGYRFYATEVADSGINLTPVSGPPVPTGQSTLHGFSASELLFSLRIYEPFRSLGR